MECENRAMNTPIDWCFMSTAGSQATAKDLFEHYKYGDDLIVTL
jgi:hypothetical protein